MPYINNNRRSYIESVSHLSDFISRLNTLDPALSEGDLNYLISSIVQVCLGSDTSYQNINKVVGVLECAKLELYRRIAVPYEDKKIKENGDVY